MERPALGHVRDDEAAGDAAVAHEERPATEEGGMNRLVSDVSNSTSEYHCVTFRASAPRHTLGEGHRSEVRVRIE